MNYDKLNNLKQLDPIKKIDHKDPDSVRVVLFNINGVKTIFHYYPWNKFNTNFGLVFGSLQADIISLQELKVNNNDLSSSIELGNLSNYRSFITLPKVKKGYSGVGLFIRIPEPSESETIKSNLTVAKAEEGLTGILGSAIDPCKSYIELNRDTNLAIGGYVDDIDPKLALQLDNEGRCIVVELANKLVIFSVYCPANSMGTEEGADFKMKFMEILIKRCQNLIALGKEVLILGDINISLDLIDQADGLNNRMKKRLITYHANEGEAFEERNASQCVEFKTETPSRLFLSRFVHLPLKFLGDDREKFLYDTTRQYQGRKMGLYTCWNTLNGARQTNYGSRIDLILTTKCWANYLIKSNNWPFLMGSDHCPIFSDFKVPFINEFDSTLMDKKLDFESRYFYKLVRHRDISSLFRTAKRKLNDVNNDNDSTNQTSERSNDSTLKYKSRKKKDQPSINNFFFKTLATESLPSKTATSLETGYTGETSRSPSISSKSSTSSLESKKSSLELKSIYGDPPKCKHGEICQLKTSLNNSKTRGKKFWCCPRNSVALDNEGRCSFFKWLNPS